MELMNDTVMKNETKPLSYEQFEIYFGKIKDLKRTEAEKCLSEEEKQLLIRVYKLTDFSLLDISKIKTYLMNREIYNNVMSCGSEKNYFSLTPEEMKQVNAQIRAVYAKGQHPQKSSPVPPKKQPPLDEIFASVLTKELCEEAKSKIFPLAKQDMIPMLSEKDTDALLTLYNTEDLSSISVDKLQHYLVHKYIYEKAAKDTPALTSKEYTGIFDDLDDTYIAFTGCIKNTLQVDLTPPKPAPEAEPCERASSGMTPRITSSMPPCEDFGNRELTEMIHEYSDDRIGFHLSLQWIRNWVKNKRNINVNDSKLSSSMTRYDPEKIYTPEGSIEAPRPVNSKRPAKTRRSSTEKDIYIKRNLKSEFIVLLRGAINSNQFIPPLDLFQINNGLNCHTSVYFRREYSDEELAGLFEKLPNKQKLSFKEELKRVYSTDDLGQISRMNSNAFPPELRERLTAVLRDCPTEYRNALWEIKKALPRKDEKGRLTAYKLSFTYMRYNVGMELVPRKNYRSNDPLDKYTHIENALDLIWSRGTPYLIVPIFKEDGVHYINYRVDKLSKVKCTEIPADEGVADLIRYKRYDPDKYRFKYINMYSGDCGPIIIKFPYSEQTVNKLIDYFGINNSRLRITSPENDICYASVNAVYEGVKLFLLERCDCCEVIYPPELRASVKEALKKSTAAYGKELSNRDTAFVRSEIPSLRMNTDAPKKREQP